jgi:hypothetical protein
MYVALVHTRSMNLVKRYTKIPAEIVVDSREVLEARPRSQPPESMKHDEREQDDDERWENAPCTD